MGGNPTLEEFEKNFPTLQFAVLRHQFPPGSERVSHWDLLLEQPSQESSQLMTFEVSTSPHHWDKPTSAIRLPDHRSIYLTYEGPISGDRGAVHRILKGAVEWVTKTEDLLVLKLTFHWESESPRPLVSAVLRLMKTSTENDGRWDLTLQSH